MKSAGEERAAVMHQLRLRKLAKMRKSAKSATDSLEAAALDDIRNELRRNQDFMNYPLQYTIPSEKPCQRRLEIGVT